MILSQHSVELGRRVLGSKTWMTFRDVDPTFLTLSMTNTVVSNCMSNIERFVVLMYDRSSTCVSVNDCRRILYTRKNRAIENIPPTSDALLQHVKRASLQAHLWISCLSNDVPQYNPLEWGWTVSDDSSYIPLWKTIPDMSSHCSELVCCSCKSGCSKSCKCRKNGLRCTKLCGCDGTCSNDRYESTDITYNVSDSSVIWEETEEDPEVDNVFDIVFDDDF